jgi:hypothetical protein
MVLDSLSGADRANLQELYARSVMLLDLGRSEEWVNLFDSRATLECVTPPGNTAPIRFTGREELLRLARNTIAGTFSLALGALDPPISCHHILSNICLYCDASRNVHGYAHLLVTSRSGTQPPRWLAAGILTDRLYKCASGCWLFASRSFSTDHSYARTIAAGASAQPSSHQPLPH